MLGEKEKIRRLKRKGIQDSRGYWPHIIVKFHDKFQDKLKDILYKDGVEKYLKEHGIDQWEQLAAKFPGLTMSKLYRKPEHIRSIVDRKDKLDRKYTLSNMFTYFLVDCPIGVHPEVLVKEIKKWSSVQTAYHYSPGSDPQVNPGGNSFFGEQGYLDPGPVGIDAKFAWTLAGGDGAGTSVIDLEKGWVLNHQDLNSHGTRLPPRILNEDEGGTNLKSSRHHGTAVLGVICAVNNTLGCVGIAHNVDSANVVSYYGGSTRADAIANAIVNLQEGDILLLEAQVKIKVGTKTWRKMPVEVNMDEFEIIHDATELGIVVIEAAGNGGKDLDTFTNDAGEEILTRKRKIVDDSGNPVEVEGSGFRDSGAIMVGAASSGVPHKRLKTQGPFGTNFGSRVDCYAWGEDVVSCGYGDLKEEPDSHEEPVDDSKKYTRVFKNTSSASAIIAGAALIVQGVAKKKLGYPFTPHQLRAILSDAANGTVSEKGKDIDRIGVMPDLRKILQNL